MIKEHAAKGTHDVVLNLLKSEKRGKVLDAGAGEGALSYKLQELGFDIVACDITPENFKVKEIPCEEVNLNNDLPYDNNFLDYFVAVEVIEHLENPWHFVREVSRVLKPNGRLILTTPNINSISSRTLFLYNLNYHDFGEDYTYHISPINYYMLLKMLSDADFIIEGMMTNSYIKPKLSVLFHFLYLFLKPQNRVILLGDIIIVKVKKVEKNKK